MWYTCKRRVNERQLSIDHFGLDIANIYDIVPKGHCQN